MCTFRLVTCKSMESWEETQITQAFWAAVIFLCCCCCCCECTFPTAILFRVYVEEELNEKTPCGSESWDTHSPFRAGCFRHDRNRFVNGESRDEGAIYRRRTILEEMMCSCRPPPENHMHQFRDTLLDLKPALTTDGSDVKCMCFRTILFRPRCNMWSLF